MHAPNKNNIITWLMFFELDPVIRETARTEKKIQHSIIYEYNLYNFQALFF